MFANWKLGFGACLVIVSWLLVILPCAAAAPAPVIGGDAGYGKLTVYSDVLGADIYVDAKFVGQDRATISNIPAGKHYVRVAKEDKNIQTGLVDVREGEETIIVAKQSEEELLSRIRKPNQVLFYGNFVDLEHFSTVPPGQLVAAGTYSFDYKPQYGYGAEIEFPIPVVDVRVDVGFSQNYPSALVVSPTEEANLSISAPYLNISRNLFKTSILKINGGGGINYSIYSPGVRTSITVESRIGYQAFLEAVRSSGENQSFVLRVGYASFYGRGVGSVRTAPDTYVSFPLDINDPGIYVQAGVAYQL